MCLHIYICWEGQWHLANIKSSTSSKAREMTVPTYVALKGNCSEEDTDLCSQGINDWTWGNSLELLRGGLDWTLRRTVQMVRCWVGCPWRWWCPHLEDIYETYGCGIKWQSLLMGLSRSGQQLSLMILKIFSNQNDSMYNTTDRCQVTSYFMW